MRSIVNNGLTTAVLMFAVLHLLRLATNAETAQCAVPPGGAITCESGQVASCTVRDGKIDGRCKTPPSNKSGLELKAFVLSDLTGKSVSAEDLNKPEYKDAWGQGRAKTREGGVVNFKIPEGMLKGPELKD
jgi:hypothetical protein